MDSRIKAFVERMGIFSEDEGMTRIGGRIFGLLLTSAGECSLDDIAGTLGVSRASVSTDARRLVQMGLIERHSRPGDRRDYYSVGRASLRSMLERRLRGIQRFAELLREAQDATAKNAEVRERLERWSAGNQEALAVFTGLIERLDAQPMTPAAPAARGESKRAPASGRALKTRQTRR